MAVTFSPSLSRHALTEKLPEVASAQAAPPRGSIVGELPEFPAPQKNDRFSSPPRTTSYSSRQTESRIPAAAEAAAAPAVTPNGAVELTARLAAMRLDGGEQLTSRSRSATTHTPSHSRPQPAPKPLSEQEKKLRERFKRIDALERRFTQTVTRYTGLKGNQKIHSMGPKLMTVLFPYLVKIPVPSEYQSINAFKLAYRDFSTKITDLNFSEVFINKVPIKREFFKALYGALKKTQVIYFALEWSLAVPLDLRAFTAKDQTAVFEGLSFSSERALVRKQPRKSVAPPTPSPFHATAFSASSKALVPVVTSAVPSSVTHSFNRLTITKICENFPKLRDATFINCKLEASTLKALEVLHVNRLTIRDDTTVTDAAFKGRLKQLSHLTAFSLVNCPNITGNVLSIVAQAQEYNKHRRNALRELTISRTTICKLEAVSRLRRLTHFTAAHCSQLPESELMHLSKLKSLNTVNISGCRLSNAGIVHLRNITTLRHLDVRHSKSYMAGFWCWKSEARLEARALVSLFDTQSGTRTINLEELLYDIESTEDKFRVAIEKGLQDAATAKAQLAVKLQAPDDEKDAAPNKKYLVAGMPLGRAKATVAPAVSSPLISPTTQAATA